MVFQNFKGDSRVVANLTSKRKSINEYEVIFNVVKRANKPFKMKISNLSVVIGDFDEKRIAYYDYKNNTIYKWSE